MTNTKLQKWTYESNYVGEDYSDYYIVCSQYRDSDTMNRSNFRTIWRDLKGMNKDDDSVIIARSGHWAVGWVEKILIHPSNVEAMNKAEDINESLLDYPVYDEDDWYMLVDDEIHSYWDSIGDAEKKKLMIDSKLNPQEYNLDSIPSEVYDRLCDIWD